MGYTGHRSLEDEGLIHMGARMYDALSGRFTSPDDIVPQRYDTRGWSRYVYVNNDPINAVDPSGHAKRGRYSSMSTRMRMRLLQFGFPVDGGSFMGGSIIIDGQHMGVIDESTAQYLRPPLAAGPSPEQPERQENGSGGLGGMIEESAAFAESPDVDLDMAVDDEAREDGEAWNEIGGEERVYRKRGRGEGDEGFEVSVRGSRRERRQMQREIRRLRRIPEVGANLSRLSNMENVDAVHIGFNDGVMSRTFAVINSSGNYGMYIIINRNQQYKPQRETMEQVLLADPLSATPQQTMGHEIGHAIETALHGESANSSHLYIVPKYEHPIQRYQETELPDERT